jgi:hypothetical protein
MLYALETLDRRKPQERKRRRFAVDDRVELSGYGRGECYLFAAQPHQNQNKIFFRDYLRV